MCQLNRWVNVILELYLIITYRSVIHFTSNWQMNYYISYSMTSLSLQLVILTLMASLYRTGGADPSAIKECAGQSDKNHPPSPYTLQGLTGIDRRSSSHDLYFWPTREGLLLLKKTHWNSSKGDIKIVSCLFSMLPQVYQSHNSH